MMFSLIRLTFALCRFLINTAPKHPAPKRLAPKCPRAQTAAPNSHIPLGYYDIVNYASTLGQGLQGPCNKGAQISCFVPGRRHPSYMYATALLTPSGTPFLSCVDPQMLLEP